MKSRFGLILFAAAVGALVGCDKESAPTTPPPANVSTTPPPGRGAPALTKAPTDMAPAPAMSDATKTIGNTADGAANAAQNAADKLTPPATGPSTGPSTLPSR